MLGFNLVLTLATLSGMITLLLKIVDRIP